MPNNAVFVLPNHLLTFTRSTKSKLINRLPINKGRINIEHKRVVYWSRPSETVQALAWSLISSESIISCAYCILGGDWSTVARGMSSKKQEEHA